MQAACRCERTGRPMHGAAPQGRKDTRGYSRNRQSLHSSRSRVLTRASLTHARVVELVEEEVHTSRNCVVSASSGLPSRRAAGPAPRREHRIEIPDTFPIQSEREAKAGLAVSRRVGRSWIQDPEARAKARLPKSRCRIAREQGFRKHPLERLVAQLQARHTQKITA